MTDEKNQNDEEQEIIMEGNNTGSANGGSGSGSSTNLNENVAGLLCYLATFVTGIIFLILEKKSKFVKFHAMQSIIFFGGIWIIGYVIDYVPLFGWLLQSLLSLLGFIMWIVLMIKAYQNEYFKLPVVGQMAEDFINK
jgi:uncharacterized membrane protein